ncbi:hypothetical protein NMY22_g11205 [Coprinellus aureogranulatus]|nr:hypothetical protein NMY22_g11205 [Coprinellus aureogranulatus]
MANPNDNGKDISMFTGSHHHSFHNPDFRVAGRDFITPTIAPTIAPNISPTITVNVTTSAPATSSAHHADDPMDWRSHRPQHTHFSDASPSTHRETSSGQPSFPRAVSEPVPQKPRDPWRFSKMLGSLRRLVNPNSGDKAKRSKEKGRARGPLDNKSPTSRAFRGAKTRPLRRKASWSSDASASSVGSDVTVSSIDEPEDKMTTPDVYVSRMLKSGRGLACWQPQPRWKDSTNECGTTPGDVGTFTSGGGFKKLFNLWDDDEPVRKTAELFHHNIEYRLPPKDISLGQSDLGKGDTVVQGVTAKTLYGDDNKAIARFEFRCRAHQGAILAVTSPADLEELVDHARLKEHIFEHAELIYRHADTVCRLADDEPLYIITGCVKSDTWALAAFNDVATFLGDGITLMRVGLGYSAEDDLFVWTDRATAEAHVGRSGRMGVKNQTLFLRGFKLAFSKQFLHRMRESSPFSRLGPPIPPTLPSPLSPDCADSLLPTHDENRPSNRTQGAPYESKDEVAFGDFLGYSQGDTSSYSDGEAFQAIPFSSPAGKMSHSSHPCDIINHYILNNTHADFALCHDDDWYFLLEDPLWDDLVCSDADRAAGDLVAIRKGVAFMANTETEEANTMEDDDRKKDAREPIFFSRFYASLAKRTADPPPGIGSSGSKASGLQFEPEQELRVKLGIGPGNPMESMALPDAAPGERPPHSHPVLVWLAIHGSPNRQLTRVKYFPLLRSVTSTTVTSQKVPGRTPMIQRSENSYQTVTRFEDILSHQNPQGHRQTLVLLARISQRAPSTNVLSAERNSQGLSMLRGICVPILEKGRTSVSAAGMSLLGENSSGLLSRHVDKCHANEKPPATTTMRRKGSAGATGATASKEACDQCIQAGLPCDGYNPCAKCVLRTYRCTHVEPHQQTAPVESEYIDAPSPFSFDLHGHTHADSTSLSLCDFLGSGSESPGSMHSLKDISHPSSPTHPTASSNGSPGLASTGAFFGGFDFLSLDDISAAFPQTTADGDAALAGARTLRI